MAQIFVVAAGSLVVRLYSGALPEEVTMTKSRLFSRKFVLGEESVMLLADDGVGVMVHPSVVVEVEAPTPTPAPTTTKGRPPMRVVEKLPGPPVPGCENCGGTGVWSGSRSRRNLCARCFGEEGMNTLLAAPLGAAAAPGAAPTPATAAPGLDDVPF